jgi:hypothetical protein
VNLPHLVRRFFGALRPGPPSPVDDAWAEQMLTPDELLLYRRLPDHDRRHAVGCGRRAARALGPETESRWIAASMLHDVGKYDADLSVPGRALATVLVAGRRGAQRVERWREVGGFRHRVALYADHGDVGAAQIRRAGGREEAARWSAAHHHPETWDALGWPAAVVAALDEADQE